MATAEPPLRQSPSPARLIGIIGLTLALGYLVVLGGSFIGGHWLFNKDGQPVANDFVNVWAAGRLALEGHAASAFDWTLHRAAEVQAIGYSFKGYYGWHYPPTFLFAAMLLATLPYTVAAVTWLAATLPIYIAAVRAIVGERAGFFVALGWPAALWNVTAGQNGFMTAGLIGGTLALMERHPALAGICLGLLSYKPHFGLLFPLALLAARRWRVMAVAAGVTAATASASWLVFGTETWRAFLAWMPVTSHVVLGEGGANWSLLQSFFGLVRSIGGSENLAWTVQAIATLTLASTVVWLWRSRVSFDLKAAGLAAAALLATPYLYTYDLVALAIPVAFLLRMALANGFLRGEAVSLGLVCALLLSFPYTKTQVGLAASMIVALLIARRVLHQLHHAPDNVGAAVRP